jgi:hypothetical protein
MGAVADEKGPLRFATGPPQHELSVAPDPGADRNTRHKPLFMRVEHAFSSRNQQLLWRGQKSGKSQERRQLWRMLRRGLVLLIL